MLSAPEITEIFRRFQAKEPHPKTELNFTNTYTLLVAVVLSAQSTDAGVNKATPALFKIADSPKKMVKLGEEKLTSYIKTIGLYRGKARNIIALSQKLIDQFDSQVPQTLGSLQSLPGVGRKTANVVLNCAFNQPTMGVDTHVFRVTNRVGLAKAKTPEKCEEQLLKKIPEHYLLHAHHWLILHGRYICKAQKPRCPDCLIKDLCQYPEKTH